MKTKQIYKGEMLSRTKIKNNILGFYFNSSQEDRRDWYGDANNFAKSLAGRYNISVNKCVGVIAALSPVKTWSQNMICAEKMISVGQSHHMKQFEDKAKGILSSSGSDTDILGILNGSKISSFYMNILYPTNTENITIDRHALSVSLGKWTNNDDYQGMTKVQYNFFVDCFKYTAKKIDISPLLLQSSTWEAFRKIKTNYRQ